MNHDFDIAAATYDVEFTKSNIGQAQRSQVYQYLDNLLTSSKNMQILELNCGTGEDALHMSQLNHQVVATDISSEMIRVCKEKYGNTSITFQQLDIRKITASTFDQKFDLIFSNFGGFNCLSKEELNTFFKLAPSLINEKGKLALVIMPKNTLWEQIYFSLKGEFKKAKRRRTDSFVLANVHGMNVKTWYFNPREINENSSNFKVSKTKPIGLWVPPSYLENSVLGKQPILAILKMMDRLFCWAFLSKYADHFYIELEKNNL